MRALIWLALVAGSAAPLPPQAAEAIRKIDAACRAKDFRALRALMEPTILDEIDHPANSDRVIAQWKRDPTALANISKAIHRGCEVVNAGTKVVVCPPASQVPDDPEISQFLVALRRSKGGAWRIYQALYSD
jgi:hypothetical protein